MRRVGSSLRNAAGGQSGAFVACLWHRSAVLIRIHSHPMDGKCGNKELTVSVNLNLELLHETFRLNAHEVGRALTSLGFTNRKRTNVGFILWLDLRTRMRIHKIAHDYGIDQESRFRGESFGNDCDLCKYQEASNPVSAETKGESGIESK